MRSRGAVLGRAARASISVLIGWTLGLAMLVAAVPSSLAASQALRPRVVAGGVEFAIRAPQARLVTIAGDFNGWSTGSLALVDPDGDGVWTLTVPLRPGRHQYLFFVDGQASFFGGRVESGRAKVFGSHRPRDRELHWLLSVHAVEVLPDGGLREAPADPVSFSMLQAQETRFVDFGDVDPAAYVQARAASEEAIGRDPGNGWLSLQRLRLEASFRRAAEQERWKGRLVAQELELSCAALLDSPLLTWAEKARARAAFRWMRRGEMLGQGFEELAELSLAARARSELAGLKGAAVREQPLARFALMAATAEAEPLDEAPEFAAWRDVAGLQAAAAGGSTTAVLALCQSLAQLRSSGSEAAGLASLAGWLQRHGLAGPVSALRLPLFPRQLGETQLLELLERFEPRTALHRDLLFWIVSSTPRLRTEPRADGWLARHLAAETDPLIAGRLAVRLGYARLLAHREDEYYALLGERLRSDPSELELLLDFESFLRSLDAIGLEFHGLLANPWRAGFARALRALEPAARTNPVLLRMLAAEMIAGGELDGAAERLCRALETCPWDAGSALLLASVLRRKGTPDAALAALRACWTARPGDRELARELGRTLALETGREPLRGLLTGRFARSELAVQALQGAVEGLRTAGSPEVALAFLRGLELPDPSAAAASRRALLRLLLEGPSSVAREKEAEDLLAGATRTAPGEAAVAAPGEAASLWRRYAWLAARAHGKGELAERWARVAIRDAGGNRVWLLDAMTELRVPPEPGAALWAAEQGLAAPGDVAPFLRFLIRRALDERQPGRAAVYLSRLESLVCLPEEARSLLAGLAFCELQSGSPVGTVRAFARLAGTGPGAAAFLLAMLLLPPAALALLVWWGRRFRV